MAEANIVTVDVDSDIQFNYKSGNCPATDWPSFISSSYAAEETQAGKLTLAQKTAFEPNRNPSPYDGVSLGTRLTSDTSDICPSILVPREREMENYEPLLTTPGNIKRPQSFGPFSTLRVNSAVKGSEGSKRLNSPPFRPMVADRQVATVGLREARLRGRRLTTGTRIGVEELQVQTELDSDAVERSKEMAEYERVVERLNRSIEEAERDLAECAAQKIKLMRLDGVTGNSNWEFVVSDERSDGRAMVDGWNAREEKITPERSRQGNRTEFTFNPPPSQAAQPRLNPTRHTPRGSQVSNATIEGAENQAAKEQYPEQMTERPQYSRGIALPASARREEPRGTRKVTASRSVYEVTRDPRLLAIGERPDEWNGGGCHNPGVGDVGDASQKGLTKRVRPTPHVQFSPAESRRGEIAMIQQNLRSCYERIQQLTLEDAGNGQEGRVTETADHAASAWDGEQIPKLGEWNSRGVPGRTAERKTAPEVEQKKDTGPKTDELGSRESGANRQYIKLGKYDGQSELEAFLRRYEVCARHNGWTAAQRLDQLMCALVAPADQLLWDYDATTVVTWQDLVKKLRTRYGSGEQTALYQTRLNLLKQKNGDELIDVVQEVRRLMTLAYPGCGTEFAEVLAKRAFFAAMRDQRLALRVQETEPKTLDQAYKTASRLDGYRQAAEKGQDQYDRRYGNVRTVQEPLRSEAEWRQVLRQELMPQARRLERLEQALEAIGEKSRSRFSANTPWNEREADRRERTTPDPRGKRLEKKTRDDRCFVCRKPGHFARDCEVQQEPAVTEREKQEPIPLDAAHTRHPMSRPHNYLYAKINQKSAAVLVDSGSCRSLVPSRLVKTENICGSRQNLRAANGTILEVIGETSVQCQIGQIRFVQQCLVSNHINTTIFGLDWLEDNRVQWNFTEKKLRIHGHTWFLRPPLDDTVAVVGSASGESTGVPVIASQTVVSPVPVPENATLSSASNSCQTDEQRLVDAVARPNRQNVEAKQLIRDSDLTETVPSDIRIKKIRHLQRSSGHLTRAGITREKSLRKSVCRGNRRCRILTRKRDALASSGYGPPRSPKLESPFRPCSTKTMELYLQARQERRRTAGRRGVEKLHTRPKQW